MERTIEPSGLDLGQADAEIQRRWFVWTAAGLTVHPVTWADRSLGLRVSRPGAHADIVLCADGWADVACRRPGADSAIHETVQLESVDGFGSMLDRVIELITWSGIGREPSRSAPTRLSGAMGFDGGILD